jgi:hypothetical protein
LVVGVAVSGGACRSPKIDRLVFWYVRRNQSIGFVDQLFIGQIHQHSMVVEIKPDDGLLFGRGAHLASPPQRRLPRSLFAQLAIP